MKIFRKIRQRLIEEDRLKKYLLYALGEIVLVVLGILIAVSINEGIQDRKARADEIENYRLIIADLRGDLKLFEEYEEQFTGMLNAYYKMNDIAQGKGDFRGLLSDFIVMNIEFNPVTQENHQSNIEKMADREIREQLVVYFRQLDRVRQARDEFNKFLEEVSRPYFLKEQEIFKNEEVFNPEDRSFPPARGVSVVDTLKLKKAMENPAFTPILSSQRMSLGFYLNSLERSIESNQQLIAFLESKLED